MRTNKKCYSIAFPSERKKLCFAAGFSRRRRTNKKRYGIAFPSERKKLCFAAGFSRRRRTNKKRYGIAFPSERKKLCFAAGSAHLRVAVRLFRQAKFSFRLSVFCLRLLFPKILLRYTRSAFREPCTFFVKFESSHSTPFFSLWSFYCKYRICTVQGGEGVKQKL